MKPQAQLISTLLVFGIVVGAAAPTRADPESDRFKAEIDGFIARLAPSGNGAVRWGGSDPYEIRHDGAALVADIHNAKLTFGTGDKAVKAVLDRIEIRRTAQPDKKAIDFAVLLPRNVAITQHGGTIAKLALTDAKLDAVLDAQSDETRATAASFAAARFDQPDSGAWVKLGPLTSSYKIEELPNGAWRAPSAFEQKAIEFAAPKQQVAGGIERIAGTGHSAGPSLAALERLRAGLAALQTRKSTAGKPDLAAWVAAMQDLPQALGSFGMEISAEGLSVKRAGALLVALKKAGTALAVSGLDGENAALRITLRDDGLSLSPSVAEPDRVPTRAVVDFGLEKIGTRALGTMLKAAAGDQDRQNPQAFQQIFAAAAMLDPVLRLYDAAIDTAKIGVDMTGQASGSPIGAKGYTAAGEVVVRGFDVWPSLGLSPDFTRYLPLFAVLGVPQKAADGSPRLAFHVASTRQKMLTINGNDVDAWFAHNPAPPDAPRLLRPAEPPISGADVKRVQQALAAAGIPAAEDGVYSGSTAAAVARFQKQHGLNIDGVVDPATRRALGLGGTSGPKGG